MSRSVTNLVSAAKASRVVTVGQPEFATVVMTTAGTEYSFLMPRGCFNYMLKIREDAEGASPAFSISLEEGFTTNYLNVPPSTPYVDDQTLFSIDTTYYFKCATAGQTMEIAYNLISG
jgi:hypothetical protein